MTPSARSTQFFHSSGVDSPDLLDLLSTQRSLLRVRSNLPHTVEYFDPFNPFCLPLFFVVALLHKSLRHVRLSPMGQGASMRNDAESIHVPVPSTQLVRLQSALIARGRLTFWFDEDAVAAWRNADPPKGRGAPKVYSDTAIQCALILKSVFHLSLRSTQGFVSSLLELLRLDLPVPDYSTLSRRQSSLATCLTVSPSSWPRHVVVDATGLRVYGSGEGHVRKHRHGRRRAWRKLHLGVDERMKEIVAVEVTPSRVHDGRLLPALLDQIPGRIVQVSGDGAYDTRACYQSILEREAVATIPPRRSARLSESVDPPAWRAMRDAPLREIRRLGRYEWRISSGCTRQSLAENAMSRFKTLFGPKLSARRFDNQRVEAIIKCEVLNRMSSRGMPESVRIR